MPVFVFDIFILCSLQQVCYLFTVFPLVPASFVRWTLWQCYFQPAKKASVFCAMLDIASAFLCYADVFCAMLPSFNAVLICCTAMLILFTALLFLCLVRAVPFCAVPFYASSVPFRVLPSSRNLASVPFPALPRYPF